MSPGSTSSRNEVAIHRNKRTRASMIDHPGIFLDQELQRLGVSPTELARQLMVPPNRFSQIINGKRAITGDSALRLAHWFRNTPEFWMNLQAQYDLDVAAS